MWDLDGAWPLLSQTLLPLQSEVQRLPVLLQPGRGPERPLGYLDDLSPPCQCCKASGPFGVGRVSEGHPSRSPKGMITAQPKPQIIRVGRTQYLFIFLILQKIEECGHGGLGCVYHLIVPFM